MNPADQVAAANANTAARYAWFHAGCPATTTGPAEIPCQRTDPHNVGHVFIGGDVADRHDEGVSEQ